MPQLRGGTLLVDVDMAPKHEPRSQKAKLIVFLTLGSLLYGNACDTDDIFALLSRLVQGFVGFAHTLLWDKSLTTAK